MIVDELRVRWATDTEIAVQYSIFIKSPLCDSYDLIYKMEKRKQKEKKANLQI